MKILTKAEIIALVPARWKYQYRNYPKTSDKMETLDALLKLDVLTEENIYQTIGNKSWTSLKCRECEKEVDRIVFLAGTSEYGDNKYCETCLKKALKLFGKKEGET